MEETVPKDFVIRRAEEVAAAPRPLPVMAVCHDALNALWVNRLQLTRALALPMVGVVALRSAGYFVQFSDRLPATGFTRDGMGILLTVFEVMGMAVIALVTMRLLLPGKNRVSRFGIGRWTRRESQFATYGLLALWVPALLLTAATMPVAAVAFFVLREVLTPEQIVSVSTLLLLPFMYYVVTRVAVGG